MLKGHCYKITASVSVRVQQQYMNKRFTAAEHSVPMHAALLPQY